ncbi:Domain of uncharacterised function (DUF2825) [Escherichia coli]|nr:Domain of uncharacterised function (DUF2825) [Escherichia coli]
MPSTSAFEYGLSPLARGTPYQDSGEIVMFRFIPAGAGNTLSRFRRDRYVPVYPRWRGEHGSCEGLAISSAGLSPLARGTRVGHPQLAFPHRFIPAGAGNTAHIRTGPVNRPVYPRWRGEHSKHNLLLINDFLSQSQSTNFTVSHKQHIHYVKEHLIH